MAEYYSENSTYCLSKRGNITDDDYVRHLREVDFYCPICGAKITGKRRKKDKIYEIAHIFPHSPTDAEKKILDGVELLGENSESFENKIALCIICHTKYDKEKTVEEYNNLVSIKKKLLAIGNSRDNLSDQKMDEDIIQVLTAVANFDDDVIFNAKQIIALRIDDKIEKDYTPLRRKIKNFVSDYYLFIEQQLKLLDEQGRKFGLIASEFHSAFLECDNLNKEDTFDTIVDWLHSKNKNVNRTSCEIVVSFFVQNCEVFYEISK